MSEEFDVITRIVVDPRGSAAGIAGVQRQIDGLNRNVERVGANLTTAFRTAASYFAASAVFQGATSLTRQIIGIQTAAQNAEIGVAGLFAAMQGTGVAEQLGVARGVTAQLRADAAAGAGEMQDYVDGYQRLLGPATAVGASLEQVRELTQLGLGAGFALRGEMGLKTAAVDIVQALQGGLSASESQVVVPMLSMIGSSLQELNAAEGPEKMAIILKALRAMKPGIEAMGKTWDAQFSTLKDNAKQLLGAASAPIFERWSEHLLAANEWMAKNRDLMQEYAEVWGEKAVRVWDTMLDRAKEIAKVSVGVGVVGGAARSGLVGAAGTAVGGVGAAGAAAGAGILSILALQVTAVYSAFSSNPKLWTELTTAATGFTSALSSLWSAFGLLAPIIAPGSPLRLVIDNYGESLVKMAELYIWIGTAAVTAADGLVRMWAALGRTVADLAGLDVRAAPAWQGPIMPEVAAWQGPIKPEVRKQPPFKPTINVVVNVEQARDPYRVALTMKEVFKNMNKYQDQARQTLQAR
jgi:hypothetical protein